MAILFSTIFSILIKNIFSTYLVLSLGAMLLFGINFFSIGLLGEYIGRIYDEVNKRPSYIIEKK